jgi:hypothetical protein
MAPEERELTEEELLAVENGTLTYEDIYGEDGE